MKFCKDCKFCKPYSCMFIRSTEYSTCMHPNAEYECCEDDAKHLVTGQRPKDKYATNWLCRSARMRENLCGKDAKWFEAK